MVILSLAFSLFLLMDPIGNIPIYLAHLKEIPPRRQSVIILRELIIAFVVIILFVFVGEGLLDLLKISQETVYIAGGIILFIIALRMIFPPLKGNGNKKEPRKISEPFIVPLAIPLVAGPSVLAAVIIYAHQNPPFILLIAIAIAWIATTLLLLMASYLQKILGTRGITACERLMGLILTLIAVQMFLQGLKSFLLLKPS